MNKTKIYAFLLVHTYHEKAISNVWNKIQRTGYYKGMQQALGFRHTSHGITCIVPVKLVISICS